MIEKIAHFIWIGDELHWPYYYAIASAFDQGGYEQVIVHHTCYLRNNSAHQAFRCAYPQVKFNLFDVKNEVATVEAELSLNLMSVYNMLPTAAIQSDFLRTLIIYKYGGVYLDTDTLTLNNMQKIMVSHSCFLASEYIIFASQQHKYNPYHAIFLRYLRLLIAVMPRGWKHFEKIQKLYTIALNGAIIGAPKRHPWLKHLLVAMSNMSKNRLSKSCQIGPRLLDREIKHSVATNTVNIVPEKTFCFLPPIIARRWFLQKMDYQLVSSACAYPIIHWYASNQNKKILLTLDPCRVDAMKKVMPYCQLVSRSVKQLKNLLYYSCT